MPKIDLTGKRFGRLTVIRDTGKRSHGGVRWECVCDCGNYKEINAVNLGKSTWSCGCLNREKKIKDLTGQKFGRLTVIRITDDRTKLGEVIWECMCDCGKHTKVIAGNLGRCTRSCGCLSRELASERSKEDLTGKKFGRLTVIKESEKRTKRSIYWDCVCDCGKHTEVPPHHLKSGRTSSCGCLN
ncbi:transcriptional regulator, partial [Bacillus cereus]